MSGKAMSLKAKIRNLARKKDMSAQVVLQNYMFERFLERLSKSKYQEKFILKGGLLIAALVGIDNRKALKSRWIKYTKDYRYAEGITYEDVMDALRGLVQNLSH